MATQINDIKLYSLKELSKLLKVTKETLVGYLADGTLKGHRIGSHWFVTEAGLKAFCERRKKFNQDLPE